MPPAACGHSKTSIRDFDSEQLGSENVYTTEVPADIAAYMEKYFRKPLTSEQIRAMGRHSPRPKTDAMVVPTVDPAVQSWVGPRFPHITDKMLSACQLELLTSAGPLTSLWNDCQPVRPQITMKWPYHWRSSWTPFNERWCCLATPTP